MSTGTVTTALMLHTAKSGTKREEVTGGWEKLRSEEFHNLYAPSNIIRVIEWMEADKMGGGRNWGYEKYTQNFSWRN
jgi:hypothetical protein